MNADRKERRSGPIPGWEFCKSLGSACPTLKIHDGSKRHRVEARAAYQRSIDLGLRHQGLDVIGLDAAAIENANGVGGLFAELFPDLRANHAMRVRGNLG